MVPTRAARGQGFGSGPLSVFGMRLVHRWFAIPLALVLAVALVGWAPAVLRAAVESDIPGIPLPGPVATGPLGGPVYDVVYRVDVAPRSVLVIGLTGTTGTDFDLYLFGSTATTVQSLEGLIAKSTGPTSTEGLSFATAVGGSLYINLNGATNVQGTFTLSVQVVPDPTPPQASVLINDGSAATNDPRVDLAIGGFEDLSGVTEMSLSEDGTTFAPWQPFEPDLSWTFSGADGERRIWARVRNAVGVTSAAASDGIVLDRVPPAVVRVSPTRDQPTGEARPTVSVEFSEPIRFETWLAGGLIVQSPTGAFVPGTFTYDSRARLGTFTPTQDLILGVAYVVTVGAVVDLAGNQASPTGSWLLRRLSPASLFLAASASVVPWGASIRLTGSATLPVGASPELEARTSTATGFASLGPVQAIDGSFSLSVRPSRNTYYRATYPGTPTVSPATSREVRVLVRRLVTLVGLSAGSTRTIRAAAPVLLTADARPVRAGVALSFRLYRVTSTGRLDHAASYGRQTGADGRATLRWIPRPGRWAWRVAVLADAEYSSNMTAAYRWIVR